jgi:L-rhamnose mutarotase
MLAESSKTKNPPDRQQSPAYTQNMSANTTYQPKRHAQIIEVRAGQLAEYKKLHDAVWPDVLRQIKRSNIRNYSIFLRPWPDGKFYLFSYFEYIGSDFAADMAAMAADRRTQEWWALCKPCQQPLPDVDIGNGGWWADTEEVFHVD